MERDPKAVASLVFCNPAPGVDASRAEALEKIAAQAERDGIRSVLPQMLDRSYPPELSDRETYDTYRGRYLANDPVGFALAFRVLATTDKRGSLGQVACPALVVGGRQDVVRPVAGSEAIAGQIPGARFAAIDAGHFMPATNPKALLALLLDFSAMNIKANGITFNVQLDGPEGAPWLVFSNSLACNLTMWDDQAAYFKSRFRVLRYDQRGHGGTEAPGGPYTFDLLVADVIALFDALSIERAHFAGISMGGMTALGLAEQHPDRLLSVAPCDCSSASTPASAQQWAERIAAAEQGGMGVMIDSTVARWFGAEPTVRRP